MIIGALVRGEQPDAPRKKEIKKKNQKIFSIVSTSGEQVAKGNYLPHIERLAHSIRYYFICQSVQIQWKCLILIVFHFYFYFLFISIEVWMCCYPWIVYSITCPIDKFTFCKLSYRAIFSISCFSMRCGRSNNGFSPSSWLQYWKLIKGSTSSIIPEKFRKN